MMAVLGFMMIMLRIIFINFCCRAFPYLLTSILTSQSFQIFQPQIKQIPIQTFLLPFIIFLLNTSISTTLTTILFLTLFLQHLWSYSIYFLLTTLLLFIFIFIFFFFFFFMFFIFFIFNCVSWNYLLFLFVFRSIKWVYMWEELLIRDLWDVLGLAWGYVWVIAAIGTTACWW